MTNDISDTNFSEVNEQSAEPSAMAEQSAQTLTSQEHDNIMNTPQPEENLQRKHHLPKPMKTIRKGKYEHNSIHYETKNNWITEPQQLQRIAVPSTSLQITQSNGLNYKPTSISTT